MSIILRAINDQGNKYDLDLFQNEDLRLDISAIESGEIGDVFGVSSQQYALPSTPTNDDYFGNLYDLGATPAIAFTKTSPCQVLYNGAEVFTGKLYLDNIVTDHQGDTIYNIHVVNEVVDFKFQIQDLTLSDLDWSEYNHSLTMANITSSWTDSLFSGDVKYPLINYGKAEGVTNPTSIQAGGDIGDFDNSDTPLQDLDFRPAVKAKAIVDKIFESVNYTYSSSFFDSAYFDNLYILATQGESGNQFASPVTSSLLAQVNGSQIVDANTDTTINFTTEIYDNGNNYSNPTYTAPTDGDYTFYSQLTFDGITGVRPSVVEEVQLRFEKNGVILAGYAAINIANTTSPTFFIGPITINLLAGDTIELKMFVQAPGAGVTAQYPITLGKLEVEGNPTQTGGDVDISQIWGDDTQVIDLLDGLIQKFNLIFEPTTNERNEIIVETFNDWRDEGAQVDWSDKVDYTQKWEIRHPLQEQPRELTFTDEEDTDALNAYHKGRTDKIYGEYIYNSDSDLAIGEKTIGTFFSPTPLRGIDGAPTMILPILAQREEGRLVPFKYNPRLLYDVGMVSASMDLQGTSGGNKGYYYVKDDNGVSAPKNEYPLFHHINYSVDASGVLEDADFNQIDLHFGNATNPGHNSYHQKQYNAYVKRSAFYEYWAEYVNGLYDIDSRKVTLNIKLDPSEIQDIRLNDKIFIDGHYYRIDKITGANLLKEDSIQVTLIKTSPRKLKYPRRRIILDDGTAVDVTLDDASFSLSGQNVVYNDFESGAVVSGSVAEEAASRDGLQTYDGGNNIVWRTQPQQTFTLTSTNDFGNNDIRSSANKVNITGENNVIRGYAKQVNIVGESNDVGEYSAYSSISGTENTIEGGVINADIIGSTTSSISARTELATIIGGENTRISGSNKSVAIGQDLTIQGGNSNIAIGNFDDTAKTTKDLINVVAINQTRDLESWENAGGDDFNGRAYLGSHQTIGAVFADNKAIEVYKNADIWLTGSEYANDYIYHLSWNNVSGSNGVGNVYLPSTTPSEVIGRDAHGYKRMIRFICDNSVSNNDKIRIHASGSENLDGASGGSFDMTRAFEGLMVYAPISGSWYIIQQKA